MLPSAFPAEPHDCSTALSHLDALLKPTRKMQSLPAFSLLFRFLAWYRTKEYSFKTQPAIGSDAPLKIAVIGDIGETYNTTGEFSTINCSNDQIFVQCFSTLSLYVPPPA